MLILAAVFLVLAMISLLDHYNGLALGALVFSQTLFYIYVVIAVLTSLLHFRSRSKTKSSS